MTFKDVLAKNTLVAEYGIPYLDKELRGIFKNELVLIGARTGAGKTTIANQIAMHNSKYGGVVLFSLENFEGDLLLSETLKEYKKLTHYKNISLRDFCCMDATDLQEMAAKNAEERLSKIHIVYRKTNGFDISDMAKHFVEYARGGARIIIIDHIDYFDMHKPQAK